MKQKHAVSTIAILAAVVSHAAAMGVSSVYAQLYQQYQTGGNPPTSNMATSNMTSATNMSNATMGGNMTSAGNMSNASAPMMTNSS
jgi:hypothetical protein